MSNENMLIVYRLKNGKSKRLFCCEFCGDWFPSGKYTKNRTPRYCSSQCFGKSKRLNLKCQQCGGDIINKHSVTIRHRKYCSNECNALARKNKPLNPEWKKALSEGRKNSIKCKGENLYNWRGGKETQSIRHKEYFYKRKNNLKQEMPFNFLKCLLIAQENKCFYCGEDLTSYKAIEHLTPVSKGGDNEIFNLVYSCKKCNSEKHQQPLENYAIDKQKVYLLDKWDDIFSSALAINDKLFDGVLYV